MEKIIKIFFILFFITFSVSACSEMNENFEYFNDKSSPLNTLKTLRYSVYSKDRQLLLSCFIQDRRKRLAEFYKDDPNLEKANKRILKRDFDKYEVYFSKSNSVETADAIYKEKNKVSSCILTKIGNEWLIGITKKKKQK